MSASVGIDGKQFVPLIIEINLSCSPITIDDIVSCSLADVFTCVHVDIEE